MNLCRSSLVYILTLIFPLCAKCAGDDDCIDDSALSTFLNLDSTKEALHVPADIIWKDCSRRVNLSFASDEAVTVAPYIAELLHKDIPVLLYAGDLDYICNYMGTKAVALNLEWNHKDDFNAADDHDWNMGAGLARSLNGLTFLQVRDAGHMVPSDQPENALALITQFLHGEAF